MPDNKSAKAGISTALAVGALLVLAGLVWLLVLRLNSDDDTQVAAAERSNSVTTVEPVPTVPAKDSTAENPELESTTPAPTPETEPTASEPGSATAVPTPEPEQSREQVLELESRLLLETDLGTGSTEFSAVALNEDLNRLIIADDEGRLFEFDLRADGQPVQPPRRTLRVAVGAGDVEGIAWVSGSIYAIAHEDDGRLTVVDIDDDVLNLTSEHLVETVDTLIREENGNGLEGVAIIRHDPDLAFAVVDERPPTLHLIDQEGTVTQSISIDIGVPDISGVWVSNDGTYSVLSDEARELVELTINALGEVHVLDRLDLAFVEGWFEQPEGVARSRNGDRLYVVGEEPGRGRFSFGLWVFG